MGVDVDKNESDKTWSDGQPFLDVLQFADANSFNNFDSTYGIYKDTTTGKSVNWPMQDNVPGAAFLSMNVTLTAYAPPKLRGFAKILAFLLSLLRWRMHAGTGNLKTYVNDGAATPTECKTELLLKEK